MNKPLFGRWRANFLTGLAVVLPAVVSIGILIWLFGTVSNVTDLLLFFIPARFTHRGNGDGPMYWYWSLFAFLLAIFLICVIGALARNYFGRKIIEWVETILMRVPLLNKIYGATKQVNEAFSSGNKNSFKTVALIEFPRSGAYSIGFITSERHDEVEAKTKEKMVCVFVPTTPNPTSGFLILVPADKVIKLEMSVPEAVKYIISVGSIPPGYESADCKKPED